MSKVIVIGGSAGAINALKLILPTLPHDLPAAILIVTHIGSQRSILPEILGRYSSMPVRHATDGEPIVPGRVLVAFPDEHLMVVKNGNRAYARLVHGPKENHCRPAIDPLFRSAAKVFGPYAIGIVLSGYLDDGTIGLQAIKTCRGITVVQNPAEAEASDMPFSVHGRPRFAKHSIHDSVKVKIAPVHPDFVCDDLPLSLMGSAGWCPYRSIALRVLA